MDNVALILVFFFSACTAIPIIGLIRNQKVYKLRRWICDEIFKDNERYEERLKIYDKVSYHKMAMDLFRPLKLETYWTKEEIEKMLG